MVVFQGDMNSIVPMMLGFESVELCRSRIDPVLLI